MNRTLFAALRQTAMTAAVIGIAMATTTASANRLEEIKARGKFICATLPSSVPLSYPDPTTRQYVGFDVDTCAGIAKRLGVALEQRPITVEARIPEINLGRVDLVAATLGYTAQRAEQIAFTDIPYHIPLKIMVRNGSGINKFSDLKGKKIAAIKGGAPEIYARAQIPSATMMTYQDSTTSFLALTQGKVQGFAVSQSSAVRFLDESGGKYKLLDELLTYEPVGLGIKKGEPELLAAINAALKDMEAAGELQASWDKWFGPNTKHFIPREKKLTPLAVIIKTH